MMNRLRYRVWHFEKLTRGQYLNSPGKWSYCGSFRAKTLEEAERIAAYKVGSSLVRVIPEENCDKGYL